MPDSTSLLRVAEGFLGGALGLVPWDRALTGLADAVKADHAILLSGLPQPFVATARIDERDLMQAQTMIDDGRHDGPVIEELPYGRAVLRSAMIPDSDYINSIHYNELIRPLGGFHGLAARPGAPGASLYVCRPEGSASFEVSDADTVTALLPHLNLSLLLASKTAPAARSSMDDTLLEAVSGPALICDAGARLVAANSAAEGLLDAADGIVLGATRLAAVNADDTRALRLAIAAAARQVEWERDGAARIRLARRGGRPPLLLRLVRLSRFGLAAGDPAHVAIFVTEPDAVRSLDAQAIEDAYGLSPREAEIACMMVSGASVAAIAAATGLKGNSIRVYLKRIFDKTGARSQVALVALLRGFV